RIPLRRDRARRNAYADSYSECLRLSSIIDLSFQAVTTTGSAAGCSRCRLFWVQISRATLRHVFVEPIVEGRTARQPARHNIAGERLRFHDGDVRLTRNRN